MEITLRGSAKEIADFALYLNEAKASEEKKQSLPKKSGEVKLVYGLHGEYDSLHDFVKAIEKEESSQIGRTIMFDNKHKPEVIEPLKNVPTCELFDELKTREGVDSYYVAPYEKKTITTSGPATVLVVID